MITNPVPMQLIMPDNDELPERIPDVAVLTKHGSNLLVFRRIPEIVLTCGYRLQIPEQMVQKPIRERYRSRNKYAVPHQSSRECLRRAARIGA